MADFGHYLARALIYRLVTEHLAHPDAANMPATNAPYTTAVELAITRDDLKLTHYTGVRRVRRREELVPISGPPQPPARVLGGQFPIGAVLESPRGKDQAGLPDYLPQREDLRGHGPDWALRYFGSPDNDCLALDFSPEQRRDFTIRKQVLWESETATDAEVRAEEVRQIRAHQSNNPAIGYNRWPRSRASGGGETDKYPDP